MAAPSVLSQMETSAIQVTCQQTRFHIAQDAELRDVDVRDLNITLVSQGSTNDSAKVKSQRAKSTGLEILSSAHLRIEARSRLAFVGRNGTGKSTILRSITDNLIPALPDNLRVAFMRQYQDSSEHNGQRAYMPSIAESTVLEYVSRSDVHRNKLEFDLAALTKAMDHSDAAETVRELRILRLEQAKQDLFDTDKLARLRSGARGYDARKVLRQSEKAVQDAEARLSALNLGAEPEGVDGEVQQAVLLQADLQSQLDAQPVQDVLVKAKSVLTGLGFSEKMLNSQAKTLSGGWQMRTLLASALVQTADLLILDEPTNFLDMQGILFLQKHLESLKDVSPDTAVLLVSHDRDFVNTTCDELMILRDKQLSYYPGDLDSYDKSIRHEILRMSRMKDAQDKQIKNTEKMIANSIQQGKKTGDDNKLRQAKSRQKKLDDRTGLEVSAKGTRFKLNRDLTGYHLTSRAEIVVPKEEDSVSLRFPSAPELRFESSLVSLEKVSYRYARVTKPTITEISLVMRPGDRLGILGLNGTGKSTLVKVLTGSVAPSSGQVERYSRLKIGVYSQHSVDDLITLGTTNATLTALALLLQRSSTDSLGLGEQDARKLLANVGLFGRTVSDTPIAKLSGGQLVRVALALLFLDPPHLLVLDEPSTHLDIATVSALAKALGQYTGAVVLVSHDRFMLRSVIEGEPVDADSSDEEAFGQDDDNGPARKRTMCEIKNGKMKALAGGVSAWEASLAKRLEKAGLL